MSPVQVLALDMGAESGRAIIGTFNGETIELLTHEHSDE